MISTTFPLAREDISLLCRGWASVFIVSPPGIHISLGICVWGYTYHGDTHITVTPGLIFSAKALFKGLIFGGAYMWREICVSKSIGLALFLEGNLPFFFVLLCIWGQFPSTRPRGGFYLEERFNGGFFQTKRELTQNWSIWGGGGDRGACIWRGLCMEELIFGILRY